MAIIVVADGDGSQCALQMFDADNSGLIPVEKFREAMKELVRAISQQRFDTRHAAC